MSKPVYNAHSLFLYTGVAEKEQIVECFTETIKALGIPCRFKVNQVWSSKEHAGCTFVWVSSPSVYYAFTGRNLDGTERAEYIPDENWSPPGTPLEKEIEKMESSSPCLTWAEMGDLEDRKIELEALYVRPIIKKSLPPLITNLKYRYNKEQKEHWGKIEASISIPDFGSFVIYPSHASDINENLCPYTLTCKKLPDFVNEKNLKAIFRNYASDPFRKTIRKNKENLVFDTYPYVVIVEREYKIDNSITRNRVAFITFDSNTNDARFALQMIKRLEITDPSDITRKEVIYFDHSYNNTR